MEAKLLTQWGLDPAATIQGLPQDSALASTGSGSIRIVIAPDGRRFVLKRKPEALPIALENWLLTHLAAQGVPVAPPLPTTAGSLFVVSEGERYSLYPYLPGTVIHNHYDTIAGQPDPRTRARAFGQAIARLHQGLAAMPLRPDFPVMNLPAQVCGGVREAVIHYASSGPQPALAATYAVLEEELLPAYAELPIQLIHRDPHPGNMLFEDGRVTGFIDFEIATVGPRLFDLAYCSTALLSGAGEDPLRRQTWLDLLHALVAGYDAVVRLVSEEWALLWHMQLAIQWVFIAYYHRLGMLGPAQANADALLWLYEHRDTISAALREAEAEARGSQGL